MANEILVEVYGGTSTSGGCGCGCSGGCEPGSSCGPTVEQAAQILARELSDSHPFARVVFIDTDKEGLDKYPLVGRVISMGYPFPITAINGEPRLAGSVHIGEVQAILNGD